MQKIIFIPGLGGDKRLFEFIEIDGCEKYFLKWEKPLPDENFRTYLGRITKQVNFTEPPVLIGVSMGALAAMELREMTTVKKTILISGIKTKTEMPPYFKWIRATGLNEKIPPSIIKKSAGLVKPFVSDTGNKKALQLFKEMLVDADPSFITWGIKTVINWDRNAYNENNLIHIHGTKDLVFPLRNIKNCNYEIKDGRHDMVMSKPDEINSILQKEITNIN